MSQIKNETFKIIAGDDLIGSKSIFTELSENEKIIDTFPFYKLMNNKISFSKLYLYDYFYRLKKYTQKKNLKWMRKGDFLHTPSTFYSKKLYESGNCEKWNYQFFLYEDDPSFYSMMCFNKDILIRFHQNALILYRYSATATSTVPNQRFMKDWVKLQNIYYRDSTGIEKMYFYFRKNIKIPKILNPYCYLDRIRQFYRILVINSIYRTDFKQFYISYLKDLNNMQLYYNDIKETANFFCRQVKELDQHASH